MGPDQRWRSLVRQVCSTDNNSSIVLRSYQPRAMYQLLQRKQTEFLRISRKDVGERSPQTTMIYNRYRPPSYYRHADKGAGRKSSLYHHNCTDHPRLPTFKTLVFQMTSDESIYSCFQNLRPSFPIFLCIARKSRTQCEDHGTGTAPCGPITKENLPLLISNYY